MKEKKSCLLYHLNKASNMIKWELNHYLKDYDITSAQWRVLMYLAESPHRGATPGLIAEKLNVERPAITRVIDSLVKESLIIKEDNPHDRRSQLVIPTDKAEKIMPQLKLIGNRLMEKSFNNFNNDEVQQLNAYLISVIQNLR
mgnify:CR=1 FL=1